MEFAHSNQSLPQRRETLKLALFSISGAEENFPVDEWGVFTLSFKNTKYQFQTYVLKYCKYLSNYFKLGSDNKQVILDLQYATSERALELVMKLLFGFKDVEIDEIECVQVLAILHEMGIL